MDRHHRQSSKWESPNNKDIPISGHSPGDELDKVVVERDACPGIKDGGASVTDEVRGDNLERRGREEGGEGGREGGREEEREGGREEEGGRKGRRERDGGGREAGHHLME